MITAVEPYTMYADDSNKKLSSMIVIGGYLADAAHWELVQKTRIPKVTSTLGSYRTLSNHTQPLASIIILANRLENVFC